MYQQFREVLYHGSVSEILRVDVTKGRDKKDFGKGFYIAVSKSQAVGMMHKKQREAIRRGRNKDRADIKEYLYEVKLDAEYAKTLDIKVFEQADEEWLDFILMCREKGGIPHKHDVVIGPTADDDTMLCLRAYWDGLYGKVGTSEAKRTLLNNLETENLGIQYFIGSQNVADHLIVSIIPVEWR
jgi:hypothetical protein